MTGAYEDVAFGNWLKAQLEEKDWSQGELARRAGYKPGVVSTWANDRSTPNIRSVGAIARALNLPFEEVASAAGHDLDDASQSLAEAARVIAEIRAEIREATTYLHELERAGFALESREHESDISFGADGQTPLDEWNQIGNRLTVVQQQAIIEMLRTFVES